MRPQITIASAAIIATALTVPARAQEPGVFATGPEVGTRIPDIKAPDQHGQMRTFAEMCGPDGLLILFYRTADW